MRFFLDNDVDALVASALTKENHECWTASQAGLSRAGDDDLTVYAGEKRACVVTHDREFSVRRKVNVIGHHIWLDCNEWDGAEVMLESLPDILPILNRLTDVTFTLKLRGNFDVSRGWK